MSAKLNRVSLSLCVAAVLVAVPVLGVSAAAGVSTPAEQGPKKGPDKKEKKDKNQYGTAAVTVQRGTGAPAIWATYSTKLGSPIGDTTGGAFRFTCRAADVSCKISISAAVLSDVHTGNVAFYPRVLVQRQDLNAGPQTYCEYGDGVDASGSAFLTPQAISADPNWTPFTIHIGGSADCHGPVTTAGAVPTISVPTGYYDVFSTFLFKK